VVYNLDAAEKVLDSLALTGQLHSNFKNGRKKWYEEMREQRARDIETEML
jgi:hypothetical protein